MSYTSLLFLSFVVSAGALRRIAPPNSTQLEVQNGKSACFAQQKDWKAPLSGSWVQRSPEEIEHLYSEEFGDPNDYVQGHVNEEFAQRWADHACPLEVAHFSCFYHGDNRAKVLQARQFQPDSCELSAYDAPTLLQKFRGRKIYFIGDSLSIQNFVSFGCHASKFIESTSVAWDFPSWVGHANCPFPDRSHCYYREYTSSDASLRFETDPLTGKWHVTQLDRKQKTLWKNNKEGATDTSMFSPWEHCVHFGGEYKKTSICFIFAPNSGSMDLHWSKLIDKIRSFRAKDVVVMNFGAFWHRDVVGHVEDYERRLVQVVKAVKDWKGYFLWRETSPEHFPTSDGLWHDSSVSPCRASQNYDNWRNDMANHIMSSMGIDIMYVHDNADSQWDSHVGRTYRPDAFTEDCQHWCMPSVPDLWTQVQYNMLINRA